MSSQQGRRRVTIHDVAREAGVSITTVSHALNGKGVVAETTRAHVVSVASRLGYSADAIARGLRGNRLGVLGLVIRPLDSLDSYQPEGVDYFMRFAGAAAIEALDKGFGLMLVRDPTAQGAPAIALAADGFIISDPIANDPVIAFMRTNRIPIVTVGRDIEHPEFTDWLGTRTSHDTLTALSMMHARGARRIALVTGTDANAWNSDSEQAYRTWAEQQGLVPIVHRQEERSGEVGGRAVADAMLASEAGVPDGIYCLTGRHAAGLQARLTAAGVQVPDEVMIFAGSDSEQTRNSVPPITSFDLTPEVTARAAVAMLLMRLTGDADGRPPQIETVLHTRESTNR